jgi:6-pyruvoyltetrahydropterin/6-carboxytetrahydropterin synthase
MITVSAPIMPQHVVVEFGTFKREIRKWIDSHLDHGTMLGAADPLVSALLGQGCRLYRFGARDPSEAEGYATDLAWPTVENVAVLLGRIGGVMLRKMESAPGARIAETYVEETRVNSSSWTP